MQKLNKLLSGTLINTPRKHPTSLTMSSPLSTSDQPKQPSPTQSPGSDSPPLHNSASQPESLDVDYDMSWDMWQGQFEFVGPTLNRTVTGDATSISSLEDLRFNDYIPPNEPVLIDEETFLSLHPHDFENISGPESGYFIDHSQFNDNNENLENSPKNNQTQNNLHNSNANNNSNMFVNKLNNNLCVKEKNVKNNLINSNLKLISDNPELSHKLLFKTNKFNGKKSELCDSLNEQLEILQRQVTNLADTQSNVDDRTTRARTEYAVLQAKYVMLEEQLRETELRSEERVAEEQKRHRELLARVEREAYLQNENCQIKIKTIELEMSALRDEHQRLRLQCDKQAADLHATQEKLENSRENLQMLQEELSEVRASEKKHKAEKQAAEDLMIELGNECERLRSERGPALPTTSPETLRLEELHQEMEDLRHTNKSLQEANEELQALMLTRGLEEGRSLLNGTSNSLAQELENLSQDQDTIDSATLASLTQLQSAYQDKEDENLRLKKYIDTILLNIVENYPQLLEVKSTDK